MNSAQAGADETALLAVQRAAPGLFKPLNPEQALRAYLRERTAQWLVLGRCAAQSAASSVVRKALSFSASQT